MTKPKTNPSPNPPGRKPIGDVAKSEYLQLRLTPAEKAWIMEQGGGPYLIRLAEADRGKRAAREGGGK